MSVSRFTTLFLVSLLTASGVLAATLEAARDQYASGDLDAARSELQGVLASSDDDTTRAEALNLLGTIAVDRQEWSGAYEAWSRLLAEYPESTAAAEARTKLTLVTALMDAQGEKPAAPPPAPPPPTTAPAPVPETPSAPAATPPTSPSSPPPAAPPASAPQPVAAEPAPTPAPEVGNLVLVAGRGKPYDAVADSTRRLIQWLQEQGVHAESATTGVAVVQDSDLVLAQLLEVVRERGAHSLLYLQARYGRTPDNVKYSLYQPDGSVLWETKVKGGTGWTGEPYSKSGIKEKLFGRSLKKLNARVGGPGLPAE